ncbi:type IV secretory system conjugative DNA transfer family protein [Leptolyngbya sp. AN03gr2]|uniref:type IV secretory system conjugative DNA transfer family protein n=1 Tax=unclassified Leptolyngbya TaxID=2650499 RepID=UPI003D32375F
MTKIHQTISVAPSTNPVSNQLSDLLTIFKSENGLILLLAIAGCLALAWFGERGIGKKNRLATARFASGKERAVAKRKAIRQMKARKHNVVAFKIYNSLYLPDAQRGIAISGGAGSGKTASMVLPIAQSAIAQEFPMYLYDFKYTEPNDSLVSAVLPMAVKAGYKVHIFAPGMSESEICNPLDFLLDDMDGMAARQLASVMHKCMRSEHKDASDDPFFSIAGDLLIQAVLLLAKQTKFPDMMMCQVILAMTDLPKRIQNSKLSKLTKNTFSQYLSVSGSEKTADSIRGTAQNLFVPFTTPGLANAFCDKTTVPLTITGKTLVVVGMDKSIKTAIAPFLTGIMQMVLDRNVAIARKDPFVFILDEAPTVGIDLATAFATQRSAGAVTIMGYQDFGQLEQRYGESLARTILSNCATKAWFNPQELKTAQWCSDYIGEEQLNLKQKSRGHSGGKASTNVSDNERTRKLYSPDQFLRLPSGKCILINPAIAGQGEVGIPMSQKIKIPESVEQQQDWSKRIWNAKIRDRMSQHSPQPKLTRDELRVYTERMIEEREQEAERILPLAEDPKKVDKSQISKIQAAF